MANINININKNKKEEYINTQETIETLKEEPVNTPKQKNTKFIKPTVDEINKYIQEKNFDISAEEFFDHYESVGWKRGNTPMKDWRATVRTWQLRKKSYGNNKTNYKKPEINTDANKKFVNSLFGGKNDIK